MDMWVAEDMSSQELEEFVVAAAAAVSHKLDGLVDEAEVVAGPIAGKYSGVDIVEGMGADNIQPSVNRLVHGKRSENRKSEKPFKDAQVEVQDQVRDRHVIMLPQRFTTDRTL